MQIQCYYCGEWFEQAEGKTELDQRRIYDGGPIGVFPRLVCKRCWLIRLAAKRAKGLKKGEQL